MTEYFPDVSAPVFTGGVETRVYRLASFLRDRGHEVVVGKRTETYSFNTPKILIDRFLYFWRSLIGMEGSDLLDRSDPSKNYDIVEGTNFVTYIPAFFRAKRIGARSVAWYPDVFVGQAIERLGFINGIITEIAEWIALRLPWDGVIALSGETKKKLINAGIDAKKIETIYGGVNYNFYNVYKGYPKFKQPTVICIARLVKYKRVQDLLLAIYFLRERFKGIRVIIVGGGPELARLKVKSEKLKVADRVRFLKNVSEKEKLELLARSHIHVLPSIVEGFGLVTVEALAAGTPVVNADIPINREILSKFKVQSSKFKVADQKFEVGGGMLFSPGDAADLAEKIEILLSDKKLYNQKVSEGRELVKRYEWEKVNKQTERFYKAVIAKER